MRADLRLVEIVKEHVLSEMTLRQRPERPPAQPLQLSGVVTTGSSPHQLLGDSGWSQTATAQQLLKRVVQVVAKPLESSRRDSRSIVSSRRSSYGNQCSITHCSRGSQRWSAPGGASESRARATGAPELNAATSIALSPALNSSGARAATDRLILPE
jgi:hypothetical protein